MLNYLLVMSLQLTSRKAAIALAAASVLWLEARRRTSVTSSLAQAWHRHSTVIHTTLL